MPIQPYHIPVFADGECITLHPDFVVLCLTEAVLRNVLVILNNVRYDAWRVDPPLNRYDTLPWKFSSFGIDCTQFHM